MVSNSNRRSEKVTVKKLTRADKKAVRTGTRSAQDTQAQVLAVRHYDEAKRIFMDHLKRQTEMSSFGTIVFNVADVFIASRPSKANEAAIAQIASRLRTEIDEMNLAIRVRERDGSARDRPIAFEVLVHPYSSTHGLIRVRYRY